MRVPLWASRRNRLEHGRIPAPIHSNDNRIVLLLLIPLNSSFGMVLLVVFQSNFLTSFELFRVRVRRRILLLVFVQVRWWLAANEGRFFRHLVERALWFLRAIPAGTEGRRSRLRCSREHVGNGFRRRSSFLFRPRVRPLPCKHHALISRAENSLYPTGTELAGHRKSLLWTLLVSSLSFFGLRGPPFAASGLYPPFAASSSVHCRRKFNA